MGIMLASVLAPIIVKNKSEIPKMVRSKHFHFHVQCRIQLFSILSGHTFRFRWTVQDLHVDVFLV